MNSIDSFIGVPLLVCAFVGILIFLFLLIINLRKNAKASFIFYFVAGILVFGALYSNFSEQYVVFVISVLIAELVTLPYLIVKAFDDPEKREAKRAEKRRAEQEAALSQDEVTKAAVAEIEDIYQKRIQTSNDLVNKVSSFFTDDNNMDSFLEYCNKFMMERIHADGGIILMGDEFENTLVVRSLSGSFPPPYKLPDDLPHKPLRVEANLRYAQFQLGSDSVNNIFTDVFTSGESCFAPDSLKEARIYQNGPEDFLRCGSYIFVPVKQSENVIGVIGLTRLPEKDKFTKSDFNEVLSFADAFSTAMKPLLSFLAYAEHTELNKDGSMATKYQKEMVPQKLPVIPNVTIGCFSTQAENVCGDFYDVIVSRKDRISFVMADVAGKGMNSLIIMIMIRAILRLAVNTAQSASTILSWANRGLCFESSKIDHFASVALVNYNSTDNTAQISTCGNSPVFIYRAEQKEFVQLSKPIEPMGVDKDTSFTDIDLTLSKDDIIVTCTDGLIESLNDDGVQYSVENLKKVIVKNASSNAKDISNRVKDDLRRYCGTVQQHDDQSILVVKIQ